MLRSECWKLKNIPELICRRFRLKQLYLCLTFSEESDFAQDSEPKRLYVDFMKCLFRVLLKPGAMPSHWNHFNVCLNILWLFLVFVPLLLVLLLKRDIEALFSLKMLDVSLRIPCLYFYFKARWDEWNWMISGWVELLVTIKVEAFKS